MHSERSEGSAGGSDPSLRSGRCHQGGGWPDAEYRLSAMSGSLQRGHPPLRRPLACDRSSRQATRDPPRRGAGRRLYHRGRDRPGRDGRGLPRPRRAAPAPGRHQGASPRARLPAGHPGAVHPRGPDRRASCPIPTSSRSTRSARARAWSTSSWATWTASRSPAGSAAAASCRSTRPAGSWRRPPTRSAPPTRSRSSIATSSPTTSCSRGPGAGSW